MILLPTDDPGFLLQIYTKNLRLIADKFIGDATLPWNQPVSLQANPHYQALKDGRFELVLTLNIQLLHGDQGSRAKVALDQAGIFMLPPMTPEQIEVQLYSAGCPLLFSYAGVHVNDLLTQAGWPPLYLLPLDFAECYRQFQQNRTEHSHSQHPFAIQVQP